MAEPNTSFATIYDDFLTRVTSDFYVEWTELDTFRQLQSLLLVSLPRFEFPRFDIFNYEEGYLEEGTYKGVESDYKEVPASYWVGGTFGVSLTREEENIVCMNMVIEWIGQQLTTTDNLVMKYTGSDYKMTSQANHIAKLKNLLEKYEAESLHLQRLYKRRIVIEGQIRTTIPILMSPLVEEEEVDILGYEIQNRNR